MSLAQRDDSRDDQRDDIAWADDATRAALQVIAEGITELAGFDVAAVSVVREAGFLQVMAVAGSDEARAELEGTTTPVDRLTRELELAEDWGWFKFVPHERLDPAEETWGWVPDLEPVDGPDAWHPLDMLVAPLVDEHGVLRGTLSIDCPSSGLRPGLPQRRVIEKYAAAAARALVVAVDREELAEQVRLLSTAREMVRTAVRELSVERMVAHVETSLLEGFRARGMWVHTFDEQGRGVGVIHTGDGSVVAMPERIARLAEAAGARAWREQRVWTLSDQTAYTAQSAVSRDELTEIRGFVDQIGAERVMFVPLGAGQECLGSLVLTRESDDPAWSPLETEAALEIGRDLGSLVLNARAFERERELVSELKALDAYKSNLIATLSHELKSPLAAMLANIELLQGNDAVDPEIGAVLSAVDRGAVRLVRVVEDLLLLAKVGDPHSALVVQPVNLVDVVEEVRTLTSITAQDRVQVIVDDDGHGVCALGGRAELEILVANLVSNALKYSPEHAPVTVMLRRVDREVVLTCSDHGIGIADRDLPRVFEEFFRSDDADVRRQTGTGLGLAIVQRILNRHRGRIEVASESGHGTTVRVYLPAA